MPDVLLYILSFIIIVLSIAAFVVFLNIFTLLVLLAIEDINYRRMRKKDEKKINEKKRIH